MGNSCLPRIARTDTPFVRSVSTRKKKKKKQEGVHFQGNGSERWMNGRRLNGRRRWQENHQTLMIVIMIIMNWWEGKGKSGRRNIPPMEKETHRRHTLSLSLLPPSFYSKSFWISCEKNWQWIKTVSLLSLKPIPLLIYSGHCVCASRRTIQERRWNIEYEQKRKWKREIYCFCFELQFVYELYSFDWKEIWMEFSFL